MKSPAEAKPTPPAEPVTTTPPSGMAYSDELDVTGLVIEKVVDGGANALENDGARAATRTYEKDFMVEL